MHILSTLTTSHLDRLINMDAFLECVNKVIAENNVQNLGKVAHEFPGGGFTMVVCLAESHIAIHTWPEVNIATMDVYLCNYLNDNSEKCEAIFQSLSNYFAPESVNTTKVVR